MQSQLLSGIHGPRVGVRQIIHVGAGILLTLLVRFGVFRLSTFLFFGFGRVWVTSQSAHR